MVPLEAKHQAEQHAHRRRLAGAVRPEEAVAVAGAHVERDVFDDGQLAVTLGQAFGANHPPPPPKICGLPVFVGGCRTRSRAIASSSARVTLPSRT